MNTEFAPLARQLTRIHELFSALWAVGEPIFTESVETSAVVFGRKGAPLMFLWNPSFWEQLNPYEREFVACHEMLHVVLNHGVRSLDCWVPFLANIAADVVVNHMLVERFGFVRELYRGWENLCWMDTVFATPPKVSMSLEAVYAAIQSNAGARRPKTVDCHLFAKGELGNLTLSQPAEVVDRWIKEHLSGSALSELREGLSPDNALGTAAGTHIGAISAVPQPAEVPQVRWERVLRKALTKTIEPDSVDGWTRPYRRYAALEAGDMILPRLADAQERSEPIVRDIVFFLDASGSTWDHRDRFFALARTLDRYPYRLTLCSFDCVVREMSLVKPVVCGGGGTSFRILEKWLQDRKTRYPDAVVVLTDGVGDAIKPRFPERWHWLLTQPVLEFVPKESKSIPLTAIARPAT